MNHNWVRNKNIFRDKLYHCTNCGTYKLEEFGNIVVRYFDGTTRKLFGFIEPSCNEMIMKDILE